MRPDDPDTTPEPDDEISTRFPSEPRAREMRDGRNGGKLIVSVLGQPGYPGAGRPSKQALFRERFEDEFDEWFAVLTRARDGKDGRAALDAFKELADRAYGRSTQPISVIPLDSELPGDDLAME